MRRIERLDADPMLDVIVVATVVALFALLGLLVKGVERL
ncbi:hypothetical protein SAMN04489720_0344 [Agrococcus jejuensis]|uniref:Uncharacterized protein n=1 Tax=Agrococcus jejuensis TaxID=399736 RepID=A0A1G8AE64_9MICO|nr:hypothetical protein SAMN04489720_0344 [Agrococcus jejuensis]